MISIQEIRNTIYLIDTDHATPAEKRKEIVSYLRGKSHSLQGDLVFGGYTERGGILLGYKLVSECPYNKSEPMLNGDLYCAKCENFLYYDLKKNRIYCYKHLKK